MTKIVIPSAFQDLRKPKRYKVYYGGRGGAKSHNFARTLLIMGCENKMRIICAREIQKSIDDSVHQLLSDIIDLYPALRAFYTVQKRAIIGKNGTQFKFLGLKHNITDVKSLEGADILWVEEAENVSNRSWETVVPTIRKDGSEIWVSFNPKNRNDPTYDRFVVKADDNTLLRKVSYKDNPFFPSVLEMERVKLEKDDPEAYKHVWEGEFDTRRSGAVYAQHIATARADKRICRVPYDAVSPVFTAWDLGFGDATSIWWLQFVGRELRWLEYYENSGKLVDYYIKIIKDRPYNYSCHYLPHDGGHGNVRGLSVELQLDGKGMENKVLDREESLKPGIDLLRQTIDYSVFDESKCKDGIHALEHNHFVWNEDRQSYNSDKPFHDWSEHGSAAARYAAIAAGFEKNGLHRVKKISMRAGSGGGSFMGN